MQLNFLVFSVSMEQAKGGWYVLQTNYDHWKAPLIIDDRRTPVRNVEFLHHYHSTVVFMELRYFNSPKIKLSPKFFDRVTIKFTVNFNSLF